MNQIHEKRLSEWIKKGHKYPQSKAIHCDYKDTYRLRLKQWRIICHANTTQKKVRIFISILE